MGPGFRQIQISISSACRNKYNADPSTVEIRKYRHGVYDYMECIHYSVAMRRELDANERVL